MPKEKVNYQEVYDLYQLCSAISYGMRISGRP